MGRALFASLFVTSLLAAASSFTATSVFGQPTVPSTPPPAATSAPTTAAAAIYYTDTTNGFRVQVPDGWIAVDRSMATISPELDEEQRRNVLEVIGTGAETMAHLCPQSMAEPVVGGGYECAIVADPIKIGVEKYHFDLQTMQQFADIIESGGDITTHDLLAYTLQGERIGSFDVTVVSEVDRTTNLINAETNEIVANDVPVKIVEYTHASQVTRANNLPNEINLMLFAIYNDPESDEVAGYAVPVVMERADVVATPPGTLAQIPQVQQVLNSFELIEEE